MLIIFYHIMLIHYFRPLCYLHLYNVLSRKIRDTYMVLMRLFKYVFFKNAFVVLGIRDKL